MSEWEGESLDKYDYISWYELIDYLGLEKMQLFSDKKNNSLL